MFSIEENQRSLENCDGYTCIFRLVKQAVWSVLSRERAGISLGLQEIPYMVLAYHHIGSNYIIINKVALEIVKKTNDKKLINSYLFVVLLHEYLHSLGATEELARKLAIKITKNFLGKNHPAFEMASKGFEKFFPELSKIPFILDASTLPSNEKIEIIKNFRDTQLDYIV